MSVDIASGGDPLSLRENRPSPESPTLQGKVPLSSTSSEVPRNPSEDGTDVLDAFSFLDIPGSEQFGRVMHDIQAKRQEQLRKLHEQLRAEKERQGGGEFQINLQDLKELITEEDEEEEEDKEDGKDTKSEVVLTPLQMTAHRAWGRIRRYVEDKAMKNRNQKSKMQWSMLKQTLSHMNNMERARADLYDRYLHHPESWTDGLTHIPDNFFKKGRGGRVRPVITNPSLLEQSTPRVEPAKTSPKRSSNKSPRRDKKVGGKETKKSKPKM